MQLTFLLQRCQSEEFVIISLGSAYESEDELSPEWEEITSSDKQLQEYNTDFSMHTATLVSVADLDPLTEAADNAEIKQSTQLSAETVAKSLLQKFANRKHPAASELQWLVSFQDAPQCLLPLPQAVAVAPDDVQQVKASTQKPVSKQDSLPVSTYMIACNHTLITSFDNYVVNSSLN